MRNTHLKEVKVGVARYEKAMERYMEISAKPLRKQAQRLLNIFQRKVKTRIYLMCNVQCWIYDADKRGRGRYNEVWQSAETLAFGGVDRLTGLRWKRSRMDRAVLRLFPELVALASIALELDSVIGRPGIGEIRPTVKPKRTTNR